MPSEYAKTHLKQIVDCVRLCQKDIYNICNGWSTKAERLPEAERIATDGAYSKSSLNLNRRRLYDLISTYDLTAEVEQEQYTINTLKGAWDQINVASKFINTWFSKARSSDDMPMNLRLADDIYWIRFCIDKIWLVLRSRIIFRQELTDVEKETGQTEGMYIDNDPKSKLVSIETEETIVKETNLPKTDGNEILTEPKLDGLPILSFKSYLLEPYYTIFMPFLKKSYSDKKPMYYMPMLFALQDYMEGRLDQREQKDLHAAWANTFGNVGNYKAFNISIAKFNNTNDLNKQQKIKNCKKLLADELKRSE
jgi:hypothetical protein